MKALTINIPARLPVLTLVEDLPPVTYRPALPAITFAVRRRPITIPVFPPDGDTSRLMDEFGDFLVDENGDYLTW